MNASEVLRIADSISRDKKINKEVVFEGIEQAILSAARKEYGEEADLVVLIDRKSGQPSVKHEGEEIPTEALDRLGRIAAQTAKQVMIQKIREAERDSLFEEFEEQRSQMVNGVITRVDHGVATVSLGKVEGLLPRSEQIPGEVHKVGERMRCIVLEVRKQGTRVKIILSRSHPELVRRLFEVEIPEVAEGLIQVRSLARESGYRSKVAVSSYDNSIDCVGACVGVRGSRIKSIVDELAGERIDIVRWNDSLQVLIPNALQPAEVEDVILCPMLGRVIVLVREDQLSLAIGKKGQNVRLASKLVGWDIEVMTREELDEQLDNSVRAFSQVPHITEELAEMLVSQGFFSFDDLSVIEPDQLMEMGGLGEAEVDEIVAHADVESERMEQEQQRRKTLEREVRQAEAKAAEIDATLHAEVKPEGEEGEVPAVDGEAGAVGESEATDGPESTDATGVAGEVAEAADTVTDEAATVDGSAGVDDSADGEADRKSSTGAEAASTEISDEAGQVEEVRVEDAAE
ncbi:MAG: transcription termination factor NusA [Planctomycetaceae bacterium]